MSNGKEPHWTQTPAGRKRMSEIGKARHARTKKIKEKKEYGQQEKIRDRLPEGTFAYALGHVECFIEHYAKSTGIPSEALAAELGAVLQRKARR